MFIKGTDWGQPGGGDGPPLQPIAGKRGVHREHMLHEVEVRSVVGDVFEGDQRHQPLYSLLHGDLGAPLSPCRAGAWSQSSVKDVPANAVARS